MDCVILSRSNGNRFVVMHSKDINKDERKEYVVYFDVGSIINCSCGFFEHMGMVCRHSLKVLLLYITIGIRVQFVCITCFQSPNGFFFQLGSCFSRPV